MRCPERQLVRQLSRTAELSTLSATFEVIARRPWASALFVGTRFTVTCSAGDDGGAFEQWLGALPDTEIYLDGHFVASAEIVERTPGGATVEVLVIEEN